MAWAINLSKLFHLAVVLVKQNLSLDVYLLNVDSQNFVVVDVPQKIEPERLAEVFILKEKREKTNKNEHLTILPFV